MSSLWLWVTALCGHVLKQLLQERCVSWRHTSEAGEVSPLTLLVPEFDLVRRASAVLGAGRG